MHFAEPDSKHAMRAAHCVSETQAASEFVQFTIEGVPPVKGGVPPDGEM